LSSTFRAGLRQFDGVSFTQSAGKLFGGTGSFLRKVVVWAIKCGWYR
jgi:hypothetical protein